MCMQFNVQCAVRVCGRGRRCTVDATRGHPRQMSAETATRRTRPTTAGRWAADAAPGGSAERPPRAVTKRGVRSGSKMRVPLPVCATVSEVTSLLSRGQKFYSK